MPQQGTYDMFMPQQTTQATGQGGVGDWLKNFGQSGASKSLDAYGQNDAGSWSDYYRRYRELFGGKQPEGYEGGGYGENFEFQEVDLSDPKYAYLNNRLGREADAQNTQWQEWMDKYAQQQADRDKQFMDMWRQQQEAALAAQQAAQQAGSRSHSSGSSGSSGHSSPQQSDLDRVYQQVLGRNADALARDVYGGWDPDRVAASLRTSPEYAARNQHAGAPSVAHWTQSGEHREGTPDALRGWRGNTPDHLNPFLRR